MASPTTAPQAAAGGSAPAGAFQLKGVLQQLVQQNASDLHLKVGRPPTLRIHGELAPLKLPPMRPEDLRALAEQLMTARQVKEFTETKESDFAIGSIPYQAKSVKELNLPPVVEEIALRPRGLVLVTGNTGSGKSTALASMVQHINEKRRANIITIEDP